MKTNAEDSVYSSQQTVKVGMTTYNSGITIREHFAAMAMQGMLTHPDSLAYDIIARDAVRLADKLIESLNQ